MMMLGILLVCISDFSNGQVQAPRALKPGEPAEILFAATAPPTGIDENGKPAMATLEPIAFVSEGELRGCYGSGPPAVQEAHQKSLLVRLKRAYSPGRVYPLWWHGASWGTAVAVSACMDEDIDLTGCFRLRDGTSHNPVPASFKGVVFTGKAPAPSHLAVQMKATSDERSAFLRAVSLAFAGKSLHVTPANIHANEVHKIQLRSGHSALAGSSWFQVPTGKPRLYSSYRMFLVLEENKGVFAAVLTSFHKATAELTAGEQPKAEEQVDEESETDNEEFFDSFPLFPGEPDAIITKHTYYEDWNFSIYRRSGLSYKLVYTGCGGGA
jgi:hypothetical protein